MREILLVIITAFFGVMEQWSNGIMRKIEKPLVSSVFHPNTSGQAFEAKQIGSYHTSRQQFSKRDKFGWGVET